MRANAINQPLSIDASHSWSPNQKSNLLSHHWHCKNLTSNVFVGSKELSNSIIFINNYKIILK